MGVTAEIGFELPVAAARDDFSIALPHQAGADGAVVLIGRGDGLLEHGHGVAVVRKAGVLRPIVHITFHGGKINGTGEEIFRCRSVPVYVRQQQKDRQTADRPQHASVWVQALFHGRGSFRAPLPSGCQ
ncbi:MAG: hypothetical protein P8Z73_16550 [Desulfobacteraceae bacterium]